MDAFSAQEARQPNSELLAPPSTRGSKRFGSTNDVFALNRGRFLSSDCREFGIAENSAREHEILLN
jgi:hypothetical protein